MTRYLRLYAYFIRFSFSKAMEFRLDFFFRVVMDCIYYGVNIGFYQIIYSHTATLGGWSFEQVRVFIGGYFVLDAIIMTIFSNNVWWMPTYINRGELDYYLVKPVSSLFFLSVREFAANSFLNLVIAFAYWIWALTNYSVAFDISHLALYMALILAGTFLYYLMQMATVIPVFWTHSPHGFTDLFYSMTSFMERPHKIFGGWIRVILTTIIPFSLMASYPAEFFFNPNQWELVAQVFIAAILLLALILQVWKRGLRVYSSASS